MSKEAGDGAASLGFTTSYERKAGGTRRIACLFLRRKFESRSQCNQLAECGLCYGPGVTAKTKFVPPYRLLCVSKSNWIPAEFQPRFASRKRGLPGYRGATRFRLTSVRL